MKTPWRTLVISIFLFSIPFFGYAATQTELLDKVEKLQALVRSLTYELRTRLAEANKDFSFDRDLNIGSRGNDVERLQLYLSLYTQFYPEGYVTGYYGELTNAAVNKLKREYGIDEVGLGEKTRASLNSLIRETSSLVVVSSDIVEGTNSDLHTKSDVENDSDTDKISTTDIAHNIHDEINRIRVKNGLNNLEWDEGLARIALAHAVDQARDNKELTAPDLLCQYPTIRHEGFVNGYLVRDRAQADGIFFRSVGENIAMIPAIKTRSYSLEVGEQAPKCPERKTLTIEKVTDESAYKKSLDTLLKEARAVKPVTFIRQDYYDIDDIVNLAVEGWMDSPGHKENILYPNYTAGGVGVVKVNEYYIITHDLIGR